MFDQPAAHANRRCRQAQQADGRRAVAESPTIPQSFRRRSPDLHVVYGARCRWQVKWTNTPASSSLLVMASAVLSKQAVDGTELCGLPHVRVCITSVRERAR